MIRKQKFYGVGEIVSGELGGAVLDQSVQTHLYCYHLCVNLNLDWSRYRSHWPVSNVIFSQAQGPQPDLHPTAASANEEKK